ncbi:trypsin-like peptidase domain-containing protein [Mucilaginibacter jinjuensis]|uniref:Trypsin-like peptidase domain-containing protein n=1 Tax=Mucilaginibacter jinjuensis TaxID=1176721 RepID=A0ABY7T902_9SPHI|nr:trypsin-like peptidase domain-containing protein [Mucilaginibacter jinjuensis]WCT12218.1 trypsin-like peptidase domain-containing protein [Mucilaginibacter jinjuensis]
MRKIGLTLLTAFVGGAMAIGTYKVFEDKTANSMSFEDRQKVYFASNKSAAITSSAGEVDFTQAAAAVTPAVVYIRTTYSATASSGRDQQMEDLFGQMFGQRARPRSSQPQMASGSGVIISPDGYIVTNNHVVEKADKITVALNDHRTYQAKVIGTDPNTDLALIKITATNLPIVKMGNSDDARVGEWVLAVGNPFNLTSTVTAGIISAKGRNIGIIGSDDNGDDEDQNPFGPTRNQPATPKVNKAIESFIQTDAAINPGNSGGALVNTKGELIGINSAIASHTGSYEGYGFAIPINLAKKVLDDIEKYGSVKRGYIGVNFLELNEDAAERLNIKTTNGLYVNDLVAGGGAEQAGIRKGDIITKVDGTTIYESSDLQERVGRLQPGDKVKLTVLRDGSTKEIAVTLKGDAVAAKTTVARTKSAEELYNKLGASFKPLSPQEKSKLHVSSGVVVTQVRAGGFFDETETPVGSVIISINKQPINGIADIDKAITNTHNGMVTITGVYPDGTSFNNTFQAQN